MLSIVLKWGSFQEVLRPNTVIDCFHKGYTEPKTSIKPTFSSCFKPTLITKWEVCIPNWRKVFKLRGWEWGLCWDRRSKIYSCNKKNKFLLSRFMPFENGSMLSSWLCTSPDSKAFGLNWTGIQVTDNPPSIKCFSSNKRLSLYRWSSHHYILVLCRCRCCWMIC